jgi:hypothetical protein
VQPAHDEGDDAGHQQPGEEHELEDVDPARALAQLSGKREQLVLEREDRRAEHGARQQQDILRARPGMADDRAQEG